jgi:transcription elongation factor Elf1
MSTLEMKENVTCPFCGSKNVVITESKKVVSITYGPDATIIEYHTACSDCGEEFPLEKNPFQKNEEKAILDSSIQVSIQRMIEQLTNQGHTLASMERALSLPSRTLSKWRTEGSSMAGVTLIRLVRTFPWLLNVAAHNYAENVVFTELENAFLAILAELHAQKHDQVFVARGTAFLDNNTLTAYAFYGTNENQPLPETLNCDQNGYEITSI